MPLINTIQQAISRGEGLTVEFKKCKSVLNKDVFESVCAFLNRAGGELLLGVNDNGTIEGVSPDAVQKIKEEFVTSINNPQKINPPVYLSIEETTIEGKHILYVYIPESSQVHYCKGKIYDRNEDGDLDITNHQNIVANMFLRKQKGHSENEVYIHAEMSDLNPEVIDYARKLATVRQKQHLWENLSDIELLQSAGLYKKDWESGKYGVTLGGILLFGKDATILSVLSHHRTDAILRKENIDRYDDRDFIETNLIHSFDRLIAFGIKHLNDPFYLEKETRISLRDNIMREISSNILIHREYLNAFPAKLIIDNEGLKTENANRPHGYGAINPNQFTPFPKNPTIAKVFREIGRADELGSGVRNLFKYCKAYAKNDPQLVEGDIFKFFLPFTQQVTQHVTQQVTQQVKAKELELLKYAFNPKSRQDLQEYIGIKDREYFRNNYLNAMINHGWLAPTNTSSLTAPNQQYYTTEAGKEILNELEGDHGE